MVFWLILFYIAKHKDLEYKHKDLDSKKKIAY